MPRPLFFIVVFLLAFMACEKADDSPIDGPSTSILLDDPVPVSDNSVKLNWTASNDSILSYMIYRVVGDFENPYDDELIADLHKDSLSFIDDDVPFAPMVSYVVLGAMIDTHLQYGRYVKSNEVTYVRPIPVVNFKADDILPFLKKEVVFFINKEEGLIKAFNYKTLTETDIDLDAQIGFCSIQENNGTDELLVPRNDGWLFIYNAETLELIEQIKVSAHALSSAFINDHLIFCSTEAYYSSISVVNRNTGEAVPVSTSFGEQSLRLEKIPGSNTMFFGVTSSAVFYFTFDEEGNVLSIKESYAPWGDAYSISERYTLIPNSNSIVSTPLGLIHDNTVSLKSSLPRGNFKFSDFVVSPDGTKILAACSNNQSIEVYSLIDFTHLGSIPTKRFPNRMDYKDGTVIVVSIKESSGYAYPVPETFLVEEIAYRLE